ncbi:MAG: EAL domain-containing protein [Candidatus Eremiobacteraeota bacterium]|nr:EAL domain-containing protein [Candidatus Eremiobacteraeota bacterium]
MRDVLSAANAAIVRTRDPEELFTEACRIAVGIGALAGAQIVSIDRESNQVRIAAGEGVGMDVDLTPAVQAAYDDPTARAGVFAKSLLTRQPATINDLANNLLVLEHRKFLERGIHSIGSFPLFVDDELIGALLLGAEDPQFFDEQGTDLIANLVGNVSFALGVIDKQRKVDYLSYYDPLTGLANRLLAHKRLDQEIAAAARDRRKVVLLILNVDRFSAVNTTFGEHVGDEVLRLIGRRLRNELGESRVSRISGDQFAMTFPALEDYREVLARLNEHGLDVLAAPFNVGDREIRLTARVGGAVFPEDGADSETIFRNAEAALRNARHLGAVYRFYSPDLNREVAERLEFEAKLRRAADQGQFLLYYQPKVDLSTRKMVAVEALIRWKDPERDFKLIPPIEFVHMLEETGLIMSVGRWALEEAVRQHQEWKAINQNAPRIAVNVSSVQLRQDWLIEDVRSAMRGLGRESGLDLEITESMLMHNLDEGMAKMRQIREMGVEISIDDFGTGYSSLAYINRLPIAALKIDKSFVDGMTQAADKTTIVSTIIALARELHLKVIAEGVESDAQANLLQLLRCDQIQGYLVGRPMPAQEITGLLAA